MAKRNLWTSCWRLAAAVYGVYLAMQLANFFAHFFGRIPELLLRVNAFLVLLVAQSQNVLVTALVVGGFWLCHRRPLLRRAFIVGVLVLLAYLLLDDVYYTIFFDHFRLHLLSGGTAGTAAFKDSILDELGAGFVLNLVLAIAAGTFIVWQTWPEQETSWPFRRPQRFFQQLAAGLAVLAGCSAYAYRGFPLNHINEHPLLVLTTSAFAPKPRPLTARSGKMLDLETMRFGKASLPAGVPAKWQPPTGLAPTAARPFDKPNIVLIVLESVGAKQMLRRGGFDAKITPNLAKQASHMILVPQLYDYFPATVRSHVPLATGGRSITWGSTFSELLFPYSGPTLVGQFAAYGYDTALYSAADMGWENVGTFYRNLAFGQRFLTEDQDENFVRKNRVNSWGIDERVVFAKALDWVETARKPFFLELMTSSTHHPYSTPKGYVSPLPAGEDRWPRYLRALNFGDQAIGQVIDGLEKRGLRENTIIVVMGDHGEAFGEWHATNFTHQNYIYDENIRNFVAIIAPRVKGGPYRDPQITSIADVAPTVTALAGLPAGDFAGQDMLGPAYREKIVYFHKNAEPELWGLRDGRWKFIVQKIANAEPELYDLSQDPDEQHNLAAEHPEMVRVYEELVPEWYLRTNSQYTEHLTGYKHRGEQAFTSQDMQTVGPKLLAFGTKDSKGSFQELTLVNPEEDVLAWTYAVPFRDEKTVLYEWTAPTGRVRSFTFVYKGDWSTISVYHGAPEPMVEGKWTLRLIVDGQEALSGQFTVSGKAPVFKRRSFKR